MLDWTIESITPGAKPSPSAARRRINITGATLGALANCVVFLDFTKPVQGCVEGSIPQWTGDAAMAFYNRKRLTSTRITTGNLLLDNLSQ
jgi:hypothetical protein